MPVRDFLGHATGFRPGRDRVPEVSSAWRGRSLRDRVSQPAGGDDVKQKKKTGRPLLKIDAKQVQKLAALHCSNIEIADFIGCSVDTLHRRFAGVIEKERDGGKTQLRKHQWKAAEAGSVVMQIFLGKNLLKQSDRHELTGAASIPLIPENPIELAARIHTLLGTAKSRRA